MSCNLPIKMIYQKGDALLVHHLKKNIEDFAISKITLSPWEHVACVSNGFLVEALNSGVVKSPITKYDDKTLYNVLPVRLISPLKNPQDYSDFLTANIGDAYGYLDLLMIGFANLMMDLGVKKFAEKKSDFIARNTTPICSQLYIEALKASQNVVFPNRAAGLISPADIANNAMGTNGQKFFQVIS